MTITIGAMQTRAKAFVGLAGRCVYDTEHALLERTRRLDTSEFYVVLDTLWNAVPELSPRVFWVD